VVAKAPVAGLAKTRLMPRFGPEGAADLAAAALLDTLAAVSDADVGARIVALTGDLTAAQRGGEIASALEGFTVIPQRGVEFSERLVSAHAEAATLAGRPVLQIGMDTPQVTPGLLSDAARLLVDGAVDAVFGPAVDGGWWALGVSDPSTATVLRDVPMSRADTGALTLAALQGRGVSVAALSELADVDIADDVWSVADGLGDCSRFRQTADRYRLAR
jgi:glycosyltransferase A (GT-A) superfamily protein (DUF2064 family)